MILNDREIVCVQYAAGGNWTEQVPVSNWLCILVDNSHSRRHLEAVIATIIERNVCYVCTVGVNSERTHDLIDDTIAFREADIEEAYLPDHFIMTTWHTDFEEGMRFAIFAARHESVAINKIVLLNMNDTYDPKQFIQNL